MHSGLLIFVLVSLVVTWIYLAEVHRVIGYSHVRNYQKSIRGARFLLLINICLIAGALINRHVELTNLGW